VSATYVLGRTAEEYDRLRRQARLWEEATGRLLDRVEVACGMSCLDVGCGPGEVMRMLAQRVGPAGRVTGLDLDADVGREAIASLHADGHLQCDFVEGDVLGEDPFPGRRFDVVYARLLLFHLEDPVAAVRRLWKWTAPGGRLVLQDYDLSTVGSDRPLAFVDHFREVVVGTFVAAGCDVHAGRRLPALLVEAGVGAPDGTDVGGRLGSLAAATPAIAAIYRSLLPAALEHGITTEAESERWLEEAARPHDGPEHVLWPLLVGVHVRKGPDGGEGR
jgi:ubiquinone/menaquinone biosynthesis C-methylase UbiE